MPRPRVLLVGDDQVTLVVAAAALTTTSGSDGRAVADVVVRPRDAPLVRDVRGTSVAGPDDGAVDLVVLAHAGGELPSSLVGPRSGTPGRADPTAAEAPDAVDTTAAGAVDMRAAGVAGAGPPVVVLTTDHAVVPAALAHGAAAALVVPTSPLEVVLVVEDVLAGRADA